MMEVVDVAAVADADAGLAVRLELRAEGEEVPRRPVVTATVPTAIPWAPTSAGVHQQRRRRKDLAVAMVNSPIVEHPSVLELERRVGQLRLLLVVVV